MLYLVRTIKEVDNSNLNTDFIIDYNDEKAIKDFFSWQSFVIVTLKKISDWPQSAQYRWDFSYQDRRIQFALKAENLEEAIARCIDLDFSFNALNDIVKPLKDKDLQKIIDKINYKKQSLLQEQELRREREEKKKRSLLNEKRKEKIITIINQTLDDIKKINKKYEKTEELKRELLRLNELEGELTKIKMWSNMEKATTMLETTFSVMEQIELKHLSTIKQDDIYRISDASSVSNVDIISELDNLRRMQQATKVGAEKNILNNLYAYLWFVGVYQKFITKDVFHKIKQFKHIIGDIISYIDFWILNVTVIMSFYIAYGLIFWPVKNINLLFLSLINISLFWLVWEVPYFYRNQKFILRVLASIVVAIIVTIIIYKLIQIYFALV